MVSPNDPGIGEALRNYGFLKYFRLSGMRKQSKLLQFLVHAWDPIDHAFHIRDKLILVIIYDVYFLTG